MHKAERAKLDKIKADAEQKLKNQALLNKRKATSAASHVSNQGSKGRAPP